MSPRWTLALAGLAAVFVAALALYWTGRHAGAARERPKAEAALATAAVSGLEAKGAKDSVARVEVVVRQREAADATVTKLIRGALDAEDANAPLSPDRADRLRAADDQLRLARPQLADTSESRDPG